jgi:hypothetical protein
MMFILLNKKRKFLKEKDRPVLKVYRWICLVMVLLFLGMGVINAQTTKTTRLFQKHFATGEVSSLDLTCPTSGTPEVTFNLPVAISWDGSTEFDYEIIGTGDFNLDGNTDFLCWMPYQEKLYLALTGFDGKLTCSSPYTKLFPYKVQYTLNGYTSDVYTGSRIVAVGKIENSEFGKNITKVLWRCDSGKNSNPSYDLYIQTIDNAASSEDVFNSTSVLVNLESSSIYRSADWQVVGPAKHNGLPALIWRKSDGTIHVLSLTKSISGVYSLTKLAETSAPGHNIMALGNFDGDESTDILLQQGSAWGMQVNNNGSFASKALTPPTSTSPHDNFQVRAAADFDNNTFDELVWWSGRAGGSCSIMNAANSTYLAKIDNIGVGADLFQRMVGCVSPALPEILALYPPAYVEGTSTYNQCFAYIGGLGTRTDVSASTVTRVGSSEISLLNYDADYLWRVTGAGGQFAEIRQQLPSWEPHINETINTERPYVSAKMENFNGRPRLNIYDASTNSLIGPIPFSFDVNLAMDSAHIGPFASAGVKVHLISLVTGYYWDGAKYDWDNPIILDPRHGEFYLAKYGVAERINQILNTDPNAYIMFYLYCDPPAQWVIEHRNEAAAQDERGMIPIVVGADARVQEWWDSANPNHPDSVTVTDLDDPDYKGYHYAASTTSPLVVNHMKDTVQSLANYLEDLSKTTEARKAVIGYHVHGTADGQWYLWNGEDKTEDLPRKTHYTDFSPQATVSFRNWLAAQANSAEPPLVTAAEFDSRYSADGHEQYAINLANCLNSGGPFFEKNSTDFYKRLIIDACRFGAEGTAETVRQLAKTLKDTHHNRDNGRDVICGTYFEGYMTEKRGCLASYLDDPNNSIDYFVSPAMYVFRLPGFSGGFFHPISSTLLHNKMFLTEQDWRSWMNISGSYPRSRFYWKTCEDDLLAGRAKDAAEHNAMVSRESGMMLALGAGTWWYDISPGSFADDQIQHSAGNQQMGIEQAVAAFADEAADPKREVPKADLAVLVNDRMSHYGLFFEANGYLQMLELNQSGIPYHLYLQSDLPKLNQMGKFYKAYYFLHPQYMTSAEIDAVNQLKSCNRLLIFSHGPGLIGDLVPGKTAEQSAEYRASQITGINLHFLNYGDSSNVYNCLTQGTDCLFDQVVFSAYPIFGTSDGTDLTDTLQDASAYGDPSYTQFYKEMTSANGPWKVFFASKFPISASMIWDLTARVNCWSASTVGDAVYASQKYMTIHALKDGDKTLSLWQPTPGVSSRLCTVTDLSDGSVVPTNDTINGQTITLSAMAKGRTRNFKLNEVLSISPSPVIVNLGQTQQFNVLVNGIINNGAVAWNVNPSTLGTINSSGVFTPTTTGEGMIRAIGRDGKVVEAFVIVQSVAISISPATAMVNIGQTQQFSATVTGSSNAAVSWSVNVLPYPASSGNVSDTGLYTAPMTAGTYQVYVTSLADPSKVAHATVTVPISISPLTATVLPGTTRQFTAKVVGLASANVTWSVVAGTTAGTISSSGLYTATTTAGACKVRATAVADTSRFAEAAITVSDIIPPTITLGTPGYSGTITLSATASDNTGGSGMAKVEFYVDNVLVGTDTISPYSMTLNSTTLTNGSHVLSGKAYDKFGNIALAAKTFSVSNPLMESEPNNTIAEANVVGTENANIQGNVVESDVRDYFALTLKTKYKITINMTGPTGPNWNLYLKNASGNNLVSSTGSGTTETVIYTNTGSTNMTVYANVVWLSGTSSSNYNLKITYTAPTDYTAPTVSAASVTGTSGTITLSATATDNVGGSGVARVDFTVDGILRGTDTTVPYSMTLDSLVLANGSHSLVAKAYDVAGKSGSKTISFSINNTALAQNEVESNNTPATANSVTTSGTMVTGTISSTSDTDYFKVSMPVGSLLSATLTSPSGQNFDVYIYDTDGTSYLAGSTNGSGIIDIATTSNNSPNSVLRYIRVKYVSGTILATQNYKLQLTFPNL